MRSGKRGSRGSSVSCPHCREDAKFEGYRSKQVQSLLGRVTDERAYVSLDATGVPQQGPHGEKAEGRMPWVAAVYNPLPPDQKRDRRLRQARYVAGLMPLEQIGRELRVECQ